MTTQHILAADIGGTSSRFAWFIAQDDDLFCVRKLQFPTREADSFAHLFTHILASSPPFEADMAVVAVAGAVRDQNHANPPNIAWDIDLATISRLFPNSILINDFMAQAYACGTRITETSRKIKEGRPCPNGPLAVIGAGTGLGHCALVPDGYGGHIAIPSEAGHATFAFYGEKELEYQTFLCSETGTDYASADMVVSGPGLSKLHAFLTNERIAPYQVAARFEISSPTLIWFARFYARACRNYCLAVLPTGGLYISGGLAVKNPVIIEHAVFTAEFLNVLHYRDILEDIPIFLHSNEEIGLWGAAEYGRQYMIKLT